MKNAILIHGLQDKNEYYDPKTPAPGTDHWFSWLKKQLLTRDIYAETPTIYKTFTASYEQFVQTVERSLKIDQDTILVGHSFGGGFLVRYLSENKNIKVGKVVLVAPWLNPDKDPALETTDFFDFDIDPNLVSRTDGVTIFSSDNDAESIKQSVQKISGAAHNIKVVDFHNYGHFCYEDMKTHEFPELLEETLS